MKAWSIAACCRRDDCIGATDGSFLPGTALRGFRRVGIASPVAKFSFQLRQRLQSQAAKRRRKFQQSQPSTLFPTRQETRSL
jgi:hypothetical protein